MKINFYMMPGINIAPNLTGDFKTRSIMQLKHILSVLDNVLRLISQQDATHNHANTLTVLIGSENLFAGKEIAHNHQGANENPDQAGECIDRDIAFAFFKDAYCKLSAKYPYIIIAPGSVYLTTQKHEIDMAHYTQESERKRSPKIYAQNVFPVFHNGQWIRLIKKGTYLKYDNKHPILSESLFIRYLIEINTRRSRAIRIPRIIIPHYHEDELSDINDGLIFCGKTPLPGEEQLLQEFLATNPNFHRRTFHINGVNFGIEICADHAYLPLQPEEGNVDVQLLSSNGVRVQQLPTTPCFIQVDESMVCSYLNGDEESHQEILLKIEATKTRLFSQEINFSRPGENNIIATQLSPLRKLATEKRATPLQPKQINTAAQSLFPHEPTAPLSEAAAAPKVNVEPKSELTSKFQQSGC